MSIGTGVSSGQDTDRLIAVRPGDLGYVDHTGAVYHPQNESGNKNVPYYEITSAGDEIDIDLRSYIFQLSDPHVVFYTTWGPTAFDIIERSTGDTLAGEESGFDNTGWTFDISPTDGKLRITNFDTNSPIVATEAAWYPFVQVFEQF